MADARTHDVCERDRDRRRSVHAFSVHVVILVLVAAKLVLQLSALRPYGYFRDELYYLACADHLALGYVDHPPFSVALLALWRSMFGSSLVAIRTAPALAGALLVFVTGRLTVALGGSSIAVFLACFAVVCAPAFVSVDHVYSMNAFDHLFWTLAALCLVRALASAGARTSEISSVSPNANIPVGNATHARGPTWRWVLFGIVLGLGLLNKLSMLWFAAGTALALLVLREGRAALRTRGPYLAFAVAALLFLPHMVWQWRNAFPTAEFARNALALKYVRRSPTDLAKDVVLSMNPASLPLVLAGVVLPFATKTSARARPVAILALTAVGIVGLSKSGKPEYLDASLPMMFAAGGVVSELLLARMKPLLARVLRGTVMLTALAFLVFTLPFVLPILSERAFIAYAAHLGVKPQTSERKEVAELPQHYADMHGWDELVDGARRALDAIPESERPSARIWAVTGGYGPAAAIDVLGAAHGLPHAISTHNNYWLWGYGSEPDPMDPFILLGGPKERLEEAFADVRQVTTVECELCMPYENHKPVYIARGLKVQLSVVWSQLKHFE